MIGYETEEQQVQAIKDFWKKNGTTIIVGVVIGLGGLFGWRAYSDHIISTKEQNSIAFNESVESALESENVDSLKQFAEQHGDTGYTVLAQLIIAQQSVEDGDLEKAAAALENINTSSVAMADLAKVRLANVMIELTRYQDAIDTIDQISSSQFSSIANELKGDAYIALNDFVQAERAYQSSLDATPNASVEMKLNNIAYLRSQVETLTSETESE